MRNTEFKEVITHYTALVTMYYVLKARKTQLTASTWIFLRLVDFFVLEICYLRDLLIRQ
jgi:uncharacterized MAPEG superfamily protein